MGIAASALSVLGAFLVLVKLASPLPLGLESFAWLPYVAHVVGAFLSGAALVVAMPSRSWRDAALGGAIAIALLTLVSFGIPHAFSWTPMRTSAPWLVVIAILFATTACSALGARLALGRRFRGTAAIAFLAITIAGCIAFLGERFVHVLGIPEKGLSALIVLNVTAFVSAFLTQSVVVRRTLACTLGIPVLRLLVLGLLQAAGNLRTANHQIIGSTLFCLLAWGVAVRGARLARPAGHTPPHGFSIDPTGPSTVTTRVRAKGAPPA